MSVQAGSIPAGSVPVGTARDPRVDVLRGLSLLMIFVDHIPGDDLNWLTLHNFGFSDAAEVFVMLAGFSSMMAYGKAFQRDGVTTGLRRIALRCLRIYVFQIGLLVTAMLVVWLWTRHFQLEALEIAPLLNGTVSFRRGLTLGALPGYFDILPLYIVLLAWFPVVYALIRFGTGWALGVASLIWLWANLDHRIDLPNVMDGQGWYFNPFAWQLLFTFGAALAVWMSKGQGSLPQRRWLTALCWAYLAWAFLEAFNWRHWGLPVLTPFAMAAPDKSHLSLFRLADIAALFYLLLTSASVLRLVRWRPFRPFEACGRHSLEVFSLGCVLSMFARLVFRTYGMTTPIQFAVNITGVAATFALALALERAKASVARKPAGWPVRAARV